MLSLFLVVVNTWTHYKSLSCIHYMYTIYYVHLLLCLQNKVHWLEARTLGSPTSFFFKFCIATIETCAKYSIKLYIDVMSNNMNQNGENCKSIATRGIRVKVKVVRLSPNAASLGVLPQKEMLFWTVILPVCKVLAT